MLVLELPPQTEAMIQNIAQAQGMTAENLVSHWLEVKLSKRIERPFDFDTDEIQHAIESGFKPMPKFNSDEEFLAWANA